MKKYHINYANLKYFESQKKCTQSAKDFGFDEVISYSINDLDSDFLEKNKEILKLPRGAGYWVWKSYIIKKTLDKLNYGDLLVYSDSGSIYQSSVQPLIDTIINDTNGVLSFELTGLIEKSYTKMDCFNLRGLNNPKYTDTSQRESTYIWLIKNDLTIKLISEFVEYSQNKHIITDLPNITGNNFPTFKDHRHDQSIWSLLCKKYDITPHRLISQYGNKLVNYFPNDTWGQITLHHRNPI